MFKLILAMVNIIGDEFYLVVLGFWILGKGVLVGGMLFYKYIVNCVLMLI